MLERGRVLIWGKTYPELSSKHVETVCTGGVREDGRPIRLYPVPLRYMKTGSQYRLYDWIDVEMEKSTHDPRPESYKVRADTVAIAGHLDTKHRWRERRKTVFKDPAWQFDSFAAFFRDRKQSHRSMAIIVPGEIVEVGLVEKSSRERLEYEARRTNIQSQGNLFLAEYKELEFLPYSIRLHWRCASHIDCSCATKPHNNLVLDWGLLELARKTSWPKAVDRLGSLADSSRKELKLFVGNYRLHPQNWGIIGLWYPELVPPELQQELTF